MAWLMVRSGAEERAHEIDEDVLFIGCGDDVAINLPGTGVAERHCQILAQGDGHQVIDLGSPHGTLVNGQKVSQAMLQDGDVLVVGTQAMTYSLSGRSSPAGAPARPPAPPAAPAASAPVSKGAGGTRRRKGSRTAGARGSRAAAAAPAPRAAAAPSRGAAPARAGAGGGRARSSRARGMPDSTLYTIVGGSLIMLGLVLYWFLSQEREDWSGPLAEFEKAMDRGDQKNASELITRIYTEMSDDHDMRGWVDEQYRIYGNAYSDQQQINQEAAATSRFHGSVQAFYDKNLARSERRNDPALLRYFVEYRVEPFLQDFTEADSEFYGRVKMYAEEFKPKYDASKPYPDEWWDYEVISQMEERLEHYGESYRVLNLFLQRNPEHKHRAEAEKKIASCIDRVERTYWDPYLKRSIQGAMNAKPTQWSKAVMWLKKSWKNIGDIPDYRQQVLQEADAIRTRADKEKIRLDLDFLKVDPATLRRED